MNSLNMPNSKHYALKYSLIIWVLFIGFILFLLWANYFVIDQVARANGEVIATSRVQLIQAVDGGVLAELKVKEGDQVKTGQIIAKLDQSRIIAAVREIEARLMALKAKAVRLKAEVTNSDKLTFPKEISNYPGLAEIETALFKQRSKGFKEEQNILAKAVNLAKEEIQLINKLSKSGDINQSEVIRAKKSLNDAEKQFVMQKNQYFEDSRLELVKVEDEIAQNTQVLAQRQQQFEDSVFTANKSGIVKNIRVTTVGGVLRAGEELMQIIPIDDELIIETKVSPVDISQVKQGQSANIRFDPFDYTIYGSVEGIVSYVSADTLKEESSQGEETYYRVHIKSQGNPMTTSSGKSLLILPGMTAQIDIRSGQRTLLDYLLKPFKKTLSESFGER
ncbi:MAG: HlyD family efflux transporter periplasmic adaptor subunit [Gammaproteobacteria bacterium]|nr:HlyD family efflux transporter periplasmic adaptor subunit [Gammaproteobacteria bacterium]